MSEIPFYTEKDLKKLTQIDRGGGGVVYKGKIKSFGLFSRLFGNDNSKEIAVKKFIWARERDLELYKKEVDILLKHKHKNLVEIYGILWDGVDKSRYLGYVMEYFEEGSLKNVIFNPEKSYDLLKICEWIAQIGEVLQYLHGNKILHRNIKPASILVAGNILKLADFGDAKYSDATTTAGAGTFYYMAPEVLETGKCSPASDVYSLAITIWEIFHRTQAYWELRRRETGHIIIQSIIDGLRPTIDSAKMDEDIAELINRCWQREISERLKVKEIVDFFVEKSDCLLQGGKQASEKEVILIMGGRKNNNTADASLVPAVKMGNDPVMAMHEAQAIAIEKQQEIDRLKREKVEFEEKLRREKEELEEKLRKLVLEKEIPFYTEKEFTPLTPIEKGGGGTVSKGKIKSFRPPIPWLFGNDNSKEIAVKKFIWASERVLEDYKKEVYILLKHKHKNLVEISGILWDGVDKSRYLGYVMEYFEEGSLTNVIFNPEKSYDLWKICEWIVQIGEGLQYLDDNKILHRDIKPANILVAGNILKLADFGVAKSSDATTTAGAGTFCYMAPEVIETGKCSPASDVYSLAITIWEIFHRTPVYMELRRGETDHRIIQSIIDGRRPTIDSKKIDEDIAKLVDRCWKKEISERLKVKEIVDVFVEKGKEVEKTILIIGGVKNHRTAFAGMAVLNLLNELFVAALLLLLIIITVL